MGTTLLDLPPELIVRIASYLMTVELGQIRRTCKQIEVALFDSFANEFFTKRQFMLEHASLEALLGIANHPGLAARLSQVIIGTQAFRAEPEFVDDFDVRSPPADLPDRAVLLQTGLARDMLTEIFSKLTNLRTVGLRDYSGTGRARDGENARWRSWGWSLAGGRGTYLEPPDPIMALVLVALGASKARPKSIEVFLRHQPQLGPNFFSLPMEPLGKTVVPVLNELRTLMLAISPAPVLNSHRRGAPWLPYDEKGKDMTNLQKLLHYTPKLESLRLNFQPDQFFGFRLIEWLGQRPASTPRDPFLQDLPMPPVDLGALRSLEFGFVNVPGAALLKVFTRFDLHTISLWKVVLHCPGPKDISTDCWAEFLLQLSKSPSSAHLRNINIGHVTQCYFPGPHNFLTGPRVSFVPENTPSKEKAESNTVAKVEFQAKFAALSPQQWLLSVSKRTFVPGIHSTPEPVQEIDSDSDLEAFDSEADESHLDPDDDEGVSDED